MIVNRSYYCLARVTLEAVSAHGIHSGQGDATHDVLLVRDANGLPALPGSTLAGVLRHAYRERYGSEAAKNLFGHLGFNAHPSWLHVTWALVHDSHNRPMEGLQTNAGDDPLLAFLQDSKPLVRQRVCLEHTGAARDKGKFDVTLIPAGVRYTSFIGYWCDGSEASYQEWQRLIGMLGGQALHVGHGTRCGNGLFRVSELAQARWDLRTPEGRKAYVGRPRSRRDRHTLQAVAARPEDTLHVTLNLQSESAWRIGGGERSLKPHYKEPDLLPQHELRVSWHKGTNKDTDADTARIEHQQHLLPGSAVKGALRHRVAYHYRCLTGEYAGSGASPRTDDCPAVISLFGQAEDTNAQGGVLFFHDLFMQSESIVLMHNRIDRFTGGVINGALFSEEALWRTPLTLKINLPDPRSLAHVDAAARQALQRALEDLSNGWLPLGAGGSRGLGVFSNPDGLGPQWSDAGVWINQESETEAHT